MSDNKTLDDFEAIGKALGVLITLQAQIPSGALPLDAANALRNSLAELVDSDLFSDDVTAVFEGVGVGIVAMLQHEIRKARGQDPELII